MLQFPLLILCDTDVILNRKLVWVAGRLGERDTQGTQAGCAAEGGQWRAGGSSLAPGGCSGRSADGTVSVFTQLQAIGRAGGAEVAGPAPPAAPCRGLSAFHQGAGFSGALLPIQPLSHVPAHVPGPGGLSSAQFGASPNSALCPPLVDARLQWPSRRTTPTRTRTPRRTSEQRRRQSRHLGCCRGGTRPPQAVFWLVRGCSSLLEGIGGQTVGLEQCITSAASPLAAVRCLACLSLQERHQAAPAPAVLQPQGVSGQHGATASGGARGWRRQRQAPRARPQLCSLPAG